jgi:hypothetical protein
MAAYRSEITSLSSFGPAYAWLVFRLRGVILSFQHRLGREWCPSPESDRDAANRHAIANRGLAVPAPGPMVDAEGFGPSTGRFAVGCSTGLSYAPT